jgi:hypothetical protein
MTVANNAPAAMAAGAKVKLRSAPQGGSRKGSTSSDADMFGMFAFEREIMDRWDAGIPPAAIARELHRSESSVVRIVGLYGGDDGGRPAARSARDGSAKLLHAQLRAGQHDLPHGVAQALIIALLTSARTSGASR